MSTGKCNSPMSGTDSGCPNASADYHTCPYGEEIDDDSSECDCCESCTDQCADAI